MGKNITLTAAQGFSLGAYVAQPQGTPKGAVVVVQEIFGVNQHIRQVADGYAAQGYYAVAPKLFDRIEADIELGYDAQDMGRGIELAFQQLDHALALADLQATITASSCAWQRGGGRLLFWRVNDLAVCLSARWCQCGE